MENRKLLGKIGAAQIQGELLTLRATQDAMDKTQQAMRAQLGEMRKELYIAERAIPIKDYIDLDVWERDPDSSIMVAKVSFLSWL